MLSKVKISEIIIQGIEESNRAYEKWSGGMWLSDSGVENVLSVKIAEHLYNKSNEIDKKGFVTLETTFSEISRMSEAKVKGRPKTSLKSGYRADIVYWRKEDQPTGIIEVKRGWGKNCEKDIMRIADIISKYGKSNGGSISFGCLAVFLTVPSSSQKTIEQNKVTIKEKLAEMGSQMNGIVLETYFGKRHEIEVPPSHEYHGWTYAGVCIHVRPKAKRT